MNEIGYQQDQLPGWTQLGMDEAEKNPALQWPRSVDVFDQMRREDSQVGSVLRAVTMPIRSTEWLIDPAGASDEVVELVATDLGLPVKGKEVPRPTRRKDRFSWQEHLRLALLELVFGHSFFEQVYREENGQHRLRKLAWRPPRTISNIEVARDGGLEAIEQLGGTGDKIRIPVERLVAYVNDREGGNWVGQSLLRGAYKNWLLKDRMLRAQALTVERNGLGVPVYEQAPIPDSVKGPAEREEWLKQQKDQGLKIAKSFRAGETAGASIPNGAKLTLMGVSGKLPDTDGPIRYHDEQIARAVLAHFLNLGTETGSWALGSTFADFFTNSLNAIAEHIADVTQQHVVEDLVDLNFGEGVVAPVLVCEPIGAEHPATAEAVKSLIDSGAIQPDADLEAHMRSRYGLPAAVTKSADGEDSAPLPVAERALNAVTAAQKGYLATNKPPLHQSEVRELIRLAGYDELSGDGPDVSRLPDQEEKNDAEAMG